MAKNSKLKPASPSDLLTIEEAASIMGCGVEGVREQMNAGTLTRKRASNGELRVERAAAKRAAYIDSVLAGWPPLTPHQQSLLTSIYAPQNQPRKADPREVEDRKAGYERAGSIREARRAAEAMTACDVCNLQPEAHRIRQANAVDMHEWQPGRAEKLTAARG